MHVSFRSNKGFSLVELMVVVAIIGILAAIAVPNFQRFSAKSKQSEAKANLSAWQGANAAFNAEWQTYASSFNAIGYSPQGWVRYEHGVAGGQFPAAAPPGYAGTPLDAINTTTLYCGLGAMGAKGCGVINAPVAPGAVATAAMTASTFTAQARADISGGTAPIDTWTVDNNKQFTNTQNGLP